VARQLLISLMIKTLTIVLNQNLSHPILRFLLCVEFLIHFFTINLVHREDFGPLFVIPQNQRSVI